MLENYGINIYNKDCLEAMREMPDNAFDLAICDPPYFKGVAKESFYGAEISTTGIKRKRSKSEHWDSNIPTIEYYNELCRVSKNQIIWGINYFDFGFVGSGRIIWDKENDSSTFSKAEIASCSLIDSVQMFRFMWNGMLQGDMKNKWIADHPSPKPPQLYKWLLDKYAKEGDKILDTHGGSMSIAIAAYEYGFNLTLFELDKDYYEAGKQRVENHIQSHPKLF
jgi:site-specific DNA-methyltransferase (adenine-specific)